MNTPFLLYSDDPFEFDIGEIRFVPRKLDEAKDSRYVAYLSGYNKSDSLQLNDNRSYFERFRCWNIDKAILHNQNPYIVTGVLNLVRL